MTKRVRRKLITAVLTTAIAVVGVYLNNTQPGALQLGEAENKQAAAVPAGYYRVTEFIDGDTITVNMDGRNEKVRFIGVDTPETHKPNAPVQCFGEAAASFTKQLIGTNPVRLEVDETNSNRDRYDRLLRYVYLPDGQLINLEIVKQGYGFAYVSFPFTKMDEFKNAQTEARELNRGLWSGCDVKTITGGREQTNDLQ